MMSEFMVILRKLASKESHEVSWIYNRGVAGYFLLIKKAKGKIKVGDTVSLEKYSPSLAKKITTVVTFLETNPVDSSICIALKNKEALPYFKQALIPKMSS